MKRARLPHVDDPFAAGQRLHDAREAAGQSQRELAFPGCSAAYISRIERGERTPSLQLVRELARRLGVSEAWLATGREVDAHGNALLEAELSLGLGELDEARAGFEATLAARPTRRDEARARTGLGRVALEHGDTHEALEQLEAARSLAGTDAVPGLTEALVRSHLAAGELETALAVAGPAFEEARARGDDPGALRAAVLLAAALRPGASRDRALETLATLADDPDRLADPEWLAQRYREGARRHAEAGRAEIAAELGRRALAALALRDDAAAGAEALRVLAGAALDAGDPAAAEDFLHRGLRLAAAAGSSLVAAQLSVGLARTLVRAGRSADGLAAADDAAARLESLSGPEAGRAYALLAEVMAEAGQRSRAIELYRLAAELLDGERRDGELIAALSNLAELLEAEGRPDDALATLKRAVQTRGEASTAT